MTVRAVAVAVGTTATKLTETEADTRSGTAVRIRNASAVSDAFVGGPAVTTAAGFRLGPGEQFSLELAPDEDLYGVTASGTVTVMTLRTGV